MKNTPLLNFHERSLLHLMSCQNAAKQSKSCVFVQTPPKCKGFYDFIFLCAHTQTLSFYFIRQAKSSLASCCVEIPVGRNYSEQKTGKQKKIARVLMLGLAGVEKKVWPDKIIDRLEKNSNPSWHKQAIKKCILL